MSAVATRSGRRDDHRATAHGSTDLLDDTEPVFIRVVEGLRFFYVRGPEGTQLQFRRLSAVTWACVIEDTRGLRQRAELDAPEGQTWFSLTEARRDVVALLEHAAAARAAQTGDADV